MSQTDRLKAEALYTLVNVQPPSTTIMQREIASVFAPTLAGALVVLISYIPILFTGSHATFNDPSLVVLIAGFPSALIVSLIFAVFLHPVLSRHNTFIFLTTSLLTSLFTAILMSCIHFTLLFISIGALWGAISGGLYAILLGQPDQDQSS